MARTKFTEGRIKDEDLVTNDELGASYKDLALGISGTWPVTTDSVNTSTNTITSSGIDFTQLGIEPEDVVELAGGPNAGDYTVAQVTSATEIQVNEDLSSSSGGDDLTVYHQPGATRVGVDESDLSKISGSTVQKALESVDVHLSAEIFTGPALVQTTADPKLFKSINTSQGELDGAVRGSGDSIVPAVTFPVSGSGDWSFEFPPLGNREEGSNIHFRIWYTVETGATLDQFAFELFISRMESGESFGPSPPPSVVGTSTPSSDSELGYLDITTSSQIGPGTFWWGILRRDPSIAEDLFTGDVYVHRIDVWYLGSWLVPTGHS